MFEWLWTEINYPLLFTYSSRLKKSWGKNATLLCENERYICINTKSRLDLRNLRCKLFSELWKCLERVLCVVSFLCNTDNGLENIIQRVGYASFVWWMINCTVEETSKNTLSFCTWPNIHSFLIKKLQHSFHITTLGESHKVKISKRLLHGWVVWQKEMDLIKHTLGIESHDVWLAVR